MKIVDFVRNNLNYQMLLKEDEGMNWLIRLMKVFLDYSSSNELNQRKDDELLRVVVGDLLSL